MKQGQSQLHSAFVWEGCTGQKQKRRMLRRKKLCFPLRTDVERIAEIARSTNAAYQFRGYVLVLLVFLLVVRVLRESAQCQLEEEPKELETVLEGGRTSKMARKQQNP